MATLLDNIKQGLATSAQPALQQQSTPIINQTEQAQTLIGAKTGQAQQPPRSARLSNIAEQLQRQAATTGVQQVQSQSDQANQQAQAEAQQQEVVTSQQAAKLGEAQAQQLDELMQHTQSMLLDYQKGNRQLDLNKQKASLEAAGFLSRLQNDQYMNQLQKEAARSRLQDESRFKEELQKSVWADEQDLLTSDLSWKSLMSADNRAFNQSMAQMDIQNAIDLSRAQNAQANSQTMWSGIGSLGSAGIEGALAYKASPNAPLQTGPTYSTDAPMSTNPVEPGMTPPTEIA